MYRKSVKPKAWLSALCLLSLLCAPAHSENRLIEIDIPSQSLSSALQQLYRQSGIQSLYVDENVRGKNSPGAQGEYAVPQAMQKLLEGTGLQFEITSLDTVVLRGDASAMDMHSDGTRFTMPAMVVSATRGETDIRSAPAAASVVTAEEIAMRNVYTLDQAVNAVPGTFARRGKGLMDTLAEINMRGMPGQQRNLVMVDGIPINDSYNGRVNFAAINIQNAERIEVVRGPFSSLYGGSAMGGVINVITRPAKGTSAGATLGYGSGFKSGEAQDNLFDASLRGSVQASENLNLHAAYRHRSTDGYGANRVFRTTEPPPELSGAVFELDRVGAPRYHIGHTGDNNYEDDNLSVGIGYDLSEDSNLLLSVARSRSEYSYQNPRSLLRDADGEEVFIPATGTAFQPEPTPNFLSGSGPGRAEHSSYALTYNGTFADGIRSKVMLGYYDQPNNWFVSPGGTAATTVNGGPGTTTNVEAQHRTADVQFEIPVGSRHILTAGAYYRQGDIHAVVHALSNWRDRQSRTSMNSSDEGKDVNHALFIQDRYDISDRFTSYLGLRQDWWQGYDGRTILAALPDPILYEDRRQNTFSPKAVLVYKHAPSTFYRLGGGKSFRAPSLFDMYRTFIIGSSVFAGNPDLKPETTVSWEAGVNHTFSNGVNLAATYFANEMEDFIYRSDTGEIDENGRTVRFNENAGKARSRGVEMTLTGSVAAVHWYINYTYTKAKIISNQAVPASEGKYLQHIPKNTANAGAEWQRGKFSVGGAIRYADDRWGTDQNLEISHDVYGAYSRYTLFDAKVAYQLTRHLRAALSVDNITDEEWYDFYPAPGRSWFAEITFDM